MSKKGVRHGGRPLSIAVIRDILQNPIYIGKLRYRGKVYDGEHEGIIPVKLWERVQSTFKANSESCHQRAGRDLKPFAGLIYCGHCNAPMFVATVPSRMAGDTAITSATWTRNAPIGNVRCIAFPPRLWNSFC